MYIYIYEKHNNLFEKPRWPHPVGRPTNKPHHRNSTCGKHTFHVRKMFIFTQPLAATPTLCHTRLLKILAFT